MDILILFKIAVFFSALGSTFLLGYAFNRRANSLSLRALSGLLVSTLIYAASYFFEISAATDMQITLALYLEYLGIFFIPIFWVFIAWSYHPEEPAYNEPLLRRLKILFAIPVISNIAVWTNGYHHWVYDHIGMNSEQSISLLVVDRGPGFWVLNGIMIVFLIIGSVKMLINLIQSDGNYRKQYLLLSLAAVPPILSYSFILFQSTPYNIDTSPVAFALSGILIFWGMYNLQLFNILPIAQKLVVEAIRDAMIVLDPEGCLIEYNVPAKKLFDSRVPGINKKPLIELYPHLTPLFLSESDSYEIDLEMPSSDNVRSFSVYRSAIIDRKNHLRGNLYLLHDLTEMKSYVKELEHLASSDGLTNLLNHRKFVERAHAEAQRLDQIGSGTFSIIMFDLDKFKMINDEYGHSAGDKVLQQIGQLLLQLVGNKDLCARYGGEEFIILLYDTQMDTATTFAEQIRIAIEKTDFTYGGSKLHVTGSFGVSAYSPLSNTSWEVTLNHADTALYMAKKAGRNAVHALQIPFRESVSS
ncbi:MAG: histidine kinase N-terminal 7TM domain-containing protein [Sphaerochaetaceae bacterium]